MQNLVAEREAKVQEQQRHQPQAMVAAPQTVLSRFWLDQEEPFPPVDIYSKGDDLVVQANVPGLIRDDLRIEATASTLTISGLCNETPEGELIWRERFTGRFKRTFRLPVPVDPDHIEARLRNGVLHIVLPKAPEARPRTVKVAME